MRKTGQKTVQKIGQAGRMRWWQSIRWRLALGSMLVALLATTLLALAAIFAINYYYGSDEQARLQGLTADSAQSIGENYVQNSISPKNVNGKLRKAAATTFLRRLGTLGLIRNAQGEQYIILVYNTAGQPVYPVLTRLNPQSPAVVLWKNLNSSSKATESLAQMRQAIQQGETGTTTTGVIGQSSFGLPPRPFVAQPITAPDQGNQLGLLVIVPRYSADNTVPPFVMTVGRVVLLASLLIAIVAAIVAIIFSRTITRPLARLTSAARTLAAGDYNAQVTIPAYGEIGELAHSFNEMASQLSRDVEELRQQELWRRELIMSITHDLATPLTAIAGLGESLVDGVTQSHEDYEATGRIITRETLRLRRLVQDLHVMAKVEAGALQPQRKDLRLAGLVDEVLAVLAPEFERANVEPRNAIPYTLQSVQADPDMLTRVFSNLCANAIRHTPAGGMVTIDAVPHGDALFVSITDTGEGIPPEALPRVFERFYRVDGARQSATGGSGLGLAIVRAIVEAHGGRVWAENAATGGARITFTLPIEDQSKQRTIPLMLKRTS